MASLASMRFKHLLAVGLSLLLLSVSSWASVCELSCSLSHAYPVFEPTVGASAAQAHEVGIPETNLPHSHCGHVHTAKPASAANHSFENTSNCTDDPCAQTQTFTRVNSVEDADSGRVHFAVLASIPTIAFDVRLGTAKQEYSLTKFLPLGPLAVSLRI
jgi:hypothetical protein